MSFSQKKQGPQSTEWLTLSQPTRLIALSGIIAVAFIGFGATIDFLFSAEEPKITACPLLAPGDRFKVAGYSAVYMLNQEKRRLYFPNSEVFHTWFDNFDGITEIFSSCIDKYPIPALPPYGANYRPGSRLVKLKVSPDVYAIEPNNRLVKLESEEVVAKLYGSNWNQLVRDMSDELWPNFISQGAPITEAIPHEGMIVTPEGGGQAYYVEDGALRPIQGDIGLISGAVVFSLASDIFQTLTQTSSTIQSASLTGNPVYAVSVLPTAGQTFPQNTIPTSTSTLSQMKGTDGTVCSDSNNGSDTTPGNCTDTLGVHTNYCEKNTARDWYCAGTWNGAIWTHVECAAGGYDCASGGQICSAGACVAALTTSTTVPVLSPTPSTTSTPLTTSPMPLLSPSPSTPQTATSTSATTTPSTIPTTTTPTTTTSTTPTATSTSPTPTTQPTTGTRFSNVAIMKLTDTSITISWNTNEASNGQVKYGTTSAYGSLAYGQSSYGKPASTSHSFTLVGLKQNTKYYYNVGGYFSSQNTNIFDIERSVTTLTTGFGSAYTLTGNLPSNIKTGSGTVLDSQTFNIGTGSIFYSQAKDPIGYLYGSSLTSPPLYFANVGDAQTSCPTVSVMPPTYQGVSHVCAVANAALYTYTNPYSISFGDLASGCYTGHLVLKQNNLYAVLELTDVKSNGSFSYKYWYDANGGGNFSSLCAAQTSTSTPSVSTPSGATVAPDGTWCLDSDGNGSYQTKGTCQDKTGTYTDYCSSNVARDYYCSGTYASSGLTTITCADGGYTCTGSLGNACSDGACISATSTPKDTSSTGPLITGLSITPTSGPAGTSFTFSTTAEDVHGVSNVIFDITYPNGSYILRPNCPFNGVKTGTCVFMDTIDHASSPTQYGTYKIGTVRVTDQTGNTTTYNQNGTVENGVYSTHSFTIPSLTITAPAAPAITGVSMTGGTNIGATIQWNTDIASDSQIEYGMSASYGLASSLNSSLVTSHAVTLSGLGANTIYHFRVKSKNSAGVETVSVRYTFRTTGGQCTTDGGSWCSSSDGAGLYGFCTLDKNVLCPKSSEAITKATCTSQGRTWCVPSAGVNPDYGWCQQKGDNSCF